MWAWNILSISRRGPTCQFASLESKEELKQRRAQPTLMVVFAKLHDSTNRWDGTTSVKCYRVCYPSEKVFVCVCVQVEWGVWTNSESRKSRVSHCAALYTGCSFSIQQSEAGHGVFSHTDLHNTGLYHTVPLDWGQQRHTQSCADVKVHHLILKVRYLLERGTFKDFSLLTACITLASLSHFFDQLQQLTGK